VSCSRSAKDLANLRCDCRSTASNEVVSATPQASPDDDAAVPKQPTTWRATFWERLRFGWSSMWSFRHLNSEYESKNVPAFSTEHPAYAPPRWLSVFRRTFIAAVCYSKLDLLGARPPPKNNAGLFDVALVSAFRRFGCITSGQLRLRVVSTAGFYLPLYCINTR